MTETNSIQPFGFVGNDEVHLITLRNQNKTTFECITYGAIWHSFIIKDKHGKPVDVVVAPKDLNGYVEQYSGIPYFFGACLGRFAGRISNGKFVIDGVTYDLPQQNGVHLHGGSQGLGRKIWAIDQLSKGKNPSVSLSCFSNHMEGGYPGNLEVQVTYTLKENNELLLSFEASSDKDTVLNMTNHVCLNLGREKILQDELCIHAQKTLEVDEKLLPTGNLLPVTHSAYDFQKKCLIQKIEAIGGLDDTFIFKSAFKKNQISYSSQHTGIQLKITTNQPAAVLFAPKNLKFAGASKQNWMTQSYPAICFETQNYPDAPNHKNFPSSVLRKGEIYKSWTSYTFTNSET
ncbi:aldose epimerase family protein [Flagellimonas sp.]|uniref:aldose epimerase family protein n=1 Tax=Flagellimonas sp. TaxID=2058762 RepID=UPI003F49C2EE